MVGTNEPIRRHRPRTVRSETFRRKALNLLNGISIGLRSGEYCGRYCTVAPKASIASFTPGTLWAGRLSITTMSLLEHRRQTLPHIGHESWSIDWYRRAGADLKALGRLTPRRPRFRCFDNAFTQVTRQCFRHRRSPHRRINADRLVQPNRLGIPWRDGACHWWPPGELFRRDQEGLRTHGGPLSSPSGGTVRWRVAVPSCTIFRNLA